MNKYNDIIKIKNELRSHFKSIRQNMSLQSKKTMDMKIHSKLFSMDQYLKENIIFVYVSQKIEVDTFNIIKAAWYNNKKVAVPKCQSNKINMSFYFINSFEDMETGSFGILEPKISCCKKVNKLSKGLCIVPGLSFDKNGFRLGYGKGYYDRFLEKFMGTTVGLCYSNCIKDILPHDYFDKSMDFVITDKNIIKNI